MGVTVTSEFSPDKWQDNEYKWGETTYVWGGCGTSIYELLSETDIAFTEMSGRIQKLESYEQIAVYDELRHKALSKTLAEAIAMQETYWDVILFHMNVVESFYVTEDLTGSFDKGLSDELHVGDGVGKSSEIEFLSSLGITDNIANTAGISEGEEFSVTDDYERPFKKVFKVALRLKEDISNQPVKPITCSLTISDSFARTVDFFRPIEEQVALLEECLKETAIPIQEQFYIGDLLTKTHSLFEAESVSFADFFSRIWQARKELAEFITYYDLPMNRATKLLVDEVSMYDDILQASGQVLNNIIISHGAMNLNKFMELADRSPGYSKFVEFKVGEYDYKDALIRLKVSCMVEQAKPSINNLIMHVDIPDTDDRGTATLTSTSAATRVRFNQPYYNPPEVNVVLRTGNTGSGLLTPFVINITKEYFDVEIRNQSMQRATGTISWVSKGY